MSKGADLAQRGYIINRQLHIPILIYTFLLYFSVFLDESHFIWLAQLAAGLASMPGICCCVSEITQTLQGDTCRVYNISHCYWSEVLHLHGRYGLGVFLALDLFPRSLRNWDKKILENTFKLIIYWVLSLKPKETCNNCCIH